RTMIDATPAAVRNHADRNSSASMFRALAFAQTTPDLHQARRREAASTPSTTAAAVSFCRYSSDQSIQQAPQGCGVYIRSGYITNLRSGKLFVDNSGATRTVRLP